MILYNIGMYKYIYIILKKELFSITYHNNNINTFVVNSEW